MKTISIKAAAGTVVLKNIYGTEEYVAPSADLALENLNRLPDDAVFNTGLATIGDPHIDEYLNAGKALLVDKEAWNAKHIAAIRLYKSNSYIYLNPGDEISIETKCAEETVYYSMMKCDFLKVTGAVTESDAEEEEVAEDEEIYLDRTTGIGDDGDPINFDSEGATADMNAAVEDLTSEDEAASDEATGDEGNA